PDPTWVDASAADPESAASRYCEDEVKNPAAARVKAWAAAVVEDGGVGAARVFEGVGQDGKEIKVILGSDGLREFPDRASVPRQARWRKGLYSDAGVADQIGQQMAPVKAAAQLIIRRMPLNLNQLDQHACYKPALFAPEVPTAFDAFLQAGEVFAGK